MYDYHAHSNWSHDASASMDDMVRSAAEKGFLEIAITDHEDPDYPDPGFESELDPAGYHAALTEAAERWNRTGSPVRLVRGIELGLQPGSPNDFCRDIVNRYAFDFVLGAIHCAGGASIDTPEYLAPRSPAQAMQDYYESMLACLDEYDGFDVLAHLNNIDRYLPEVPEEAAFADYARAALRKLAGMGKGLEVNTSSYRKGLGERTTPPLFALRLFRELGGEVVTIGSDAHNVHDVGRDWERGRALLEAAGFRYLATFRDRKPTFIKL
jgi:histidinol-phosphatase (PHP family)